MRLAGQAVAVLDAMKMEHVVTAAAGGIVRLVAVAQGDVLLPGQPVLFIIEPRDGESTQDAEAEVQDPDATRPDLDHHPTKRDHPSDKDARKNKA